MLVPLAPQWWVVRTRRQTAVARRSRPPASECAPPPLPPPATLAQVRAASYASRNQLAVSQAEIDAGMEVEWERRYLSVLGVANRRLYELRIQTSEATWTADPDRLAAIADSFRCREV